MLGLEEASGGYDSHCLPTLFPSLGGDEMIALYAFCWWNEAERLAGKAGARRSRTIRFVDPRAFDLNHVVGARGMQQPALLYHFAGRSKDWDEMLGVFGVPRRHASDCRKVFQHVDAVAATRACVPGNAGVEDIFTYCEPPLWVC